MQLPVKTGLFFSTAIVATATASITSAQDAFGIHVNTPEKAIIIVEDGEIIEGDVTGIYADNGAIDLTVEEGGAVRGNGTDPGGVDRRPDAGVVIAQPGSTVVNAGSISGAAHGLATSLFFTEDDAGEALAPQPLATDTRVTNLATGRILGERGHGVVMVGGGSLTNAGLIGGSGLQPGSTILQGSAGVFMAGFEGQATVDGGIGTIINQDNGRIQGQVYGVVLSGGGRIENAGIISASPLPQGGQAPVGVVLTAQADEDGRIASLVNTGSVSGFIGVSASGRLADASIVNSGSLRGTAIGVLNNLQSGGRLTIENQEGGVISGQTNAIRSSFGSLTVNNAAGATISSTNNAIETYTSGTIVNNDGLIDATFYGVISRLTANPETGELEALAAGIGIVNSGTIIGRNNDAIRLEGGGTVVNSGSIAGLFGERSPAGNQSDGISMFPGPVQANEDYVARVTNLETGTVYGDRFGVILTGGGTIENAGAIAGGTGGALIQGIALNSDESEDRAGLDAAIINTGSIEGRGSGGLFSGYGVSFGSDLGTATLENSGTISSLNGIGVYQGSSSDLTIRNLAGGTITGATQGIFGATEGSITIDNAGTIRGNGIGDPFDSPSGAAINIATGNSSVTNTGTISGAGFGITTNYAGSDPATGQRIGIATGTTVTNSGTISGESNDGVRLIGGGIVTNSGTINGVGSAGADGVSMFRFENQPSEGYAASLVNSADGEIFGDRFGAILSGGGSIENAGSLTGTFRGSQIQSQGPADGQSGLLINSGTIAGREGDGFVFAGDLDSVDLQNSGTIEGAVTGVIVSVRGSGSMANAGAITGQTQQGLSVEALGAVAVTNAVGATITGGNVGFLAGAGNPATSSVTLDNAGTIRGEGTADLFDALSGAGVNIITANSTVTNSGTISGAGFGITTNYDYTPEQTYFIIRDGQSVQVTEPERRELLAIGTVVINSGTISGEGNDGVRLIGGGSVINSGKISGAGFAFADGVSMFRGDGQEMAGYAANVTNAAGATVSGERFAVILSGGGSIENAGTLVGGLGALIQSQGEGEGQTAIIVNSGTIAANSGYALGLAGFLDSATITNTGTIRGTDGGVSGGIRGLTTLTNSGSILGGTGSAIEFGTQAVLVNSGALTSGNGVAVVMSDQDDAVTLMTGSTVTGSIEAGEGFDTLTLDGSVLELTTAQVIGEANGFESLVVARGYWNTSGMVGIFDSVAIEQGATLQVNETTFDGELSSPILTADVALDGTLVLNFSEDDLVSALDDLTISGSGGIRLIGDAVFTVDTDTLTYTGGTTISNGGLVLTGSLAGNVTTEGDGAFTLGAGGAEGTFAGDIVNNGIFNFARSDDYDFLGAFSGSGTLNKYGAGTLTFQGDYSFAGITNIFAGRVRIGGIIAPETDFDLGKGGTLDITGNNQTIGGLEGEQNATVALGPQTLTIQQSENTVFGGALEGTGGIVKTGSGTLNLTGASTYTGATSVNGGTLAVNGSIVSPVTVNKGGTLGGNGSTGSVSIADGGTLAPGNSIGRLTVNGDLSFAANSIYNVEVNAAGQGDRIDATGRVTIANTARVAVMAENGTYGPRTDYVIVTGAGGVSGTFGSVTTDLAFLDPLLRYDANTVTLSLYRNDIDFTDVAVGTNQLGVAGAVQSLGIDNPLFEAVLVQNAAAAQAIYTDLSGEILASTITGLTDDSRHLRNALLAMPVPSEAGAFIWGTGFGGWGDFDGGLGLETDHTGFLTGLGYAGTRFAVSISGGLGSSDFEQVGRSDRAQADSAFLSANASVESDRFTGAAGLSYAWHDIETRRTVAFTGLGQTLDSQRDADTFQVFGEVAYALPLGSIALSPFARLAHVRTESDPFTEAGGSGALAVGETELSTTFFSLGGKIELAVPTTGLRPHASLAWNRAWGDRTGVTSSRFDAGGGSFAIAGVTIPKDSAEIEAGLDYDLGGIKIGASYTSTIAPDRDVHGGRITARLSF